ncbi:MAG: glycosyltransferase family 39 protein [Planctomycetaceae bacterium]|nr:glycosyltransferase family 39 protein [Planctomycetaceae bacterium]
MSPKRALAILIVVSGLLRLVAAGALGLGNDEASHFLYAVHPDLSYYDHPPMLAWVETIGLTLSGARFSGLALRSGFIALFAASTWLMWRIAGRWYGPRAGFFAALALNLTGYYGLAASTFALPDGPLLFFWLLTIDRLSVALEQPRRTWPWVWVGLAWGGAMLSKYHAIFLPAGMLLFLIVHRPLRYWLARPGPYLAVSIGLVVFSPVLVWNASHGWASFLFQGGRAVAGLVPRPDYLAAAMLAQAGYLFPWIWIPLFSLMVREARNWSHLESEHERLALCLAVAPVLVFTAVACFRPVLPHWGLIGLVSLFPVLGDSWRKHADRRPGPTVRWVSIAAVFPVILLGLTILEYRTGCFQRGGDARWGIFEARTDPTADLYGWDLVAGRLEELGVLDDKNAFLFTRTWYQSAQVAHAIHLRLPVLCYNIDDPRGFAFWSKPGQWLGHDGILLVINDDFVPVSFYRRWFQEAVPLAEFTIERGGLPVRRVQAFRLINQLAAFPFDFSPERAAAREVLRAGGHPMDHTQQTVRRPSPEGTLAR